MNRQKDSVAADRAATFAPAAQGGAGPAVARITDVPDAGSIEVEFARGRRCPARTVAGLVPADPSRIVGREVLLVFEEGDPEAPIAVALMGSPLDATDSETAHADLDARVDGKRIVIQADTRLELRCGKASIVIEKDGKITIKGAHLLNRATGPIRIKGGHVDIN